LASQRQMRDYAVPNAIRLKAVTATSEQTGALTEPAGATRQQGAAPTSPGFPPRAPRRRALH